MTRFKYLLIGGSIWCESKTHWIKSINIGSLPDFYVGHGKADRAVMLHPSITLQKETPWSLKYS